MWKCVTSDARVVSRLTHASHDDHAHVALVMAELVRTRPAWGVALPGGVTAAPARSKLQVFPKMAMAFLHRGQASLSLPCAV